MTDPHTEEESIELVELESSDGSLEEFAILDRLQIQDVNYAIMMLLEDLEGFGNMTQEEFEEVDCEGAVFVMRQEGESFVELSEEEYEQIREDLEQKLLELGA